MRAAAALAFSLALVFGGCGDDASDLPPDADRGAGVGALGGGARVATLARAQLPERPAGPLAWIADETRLPPGEEIEHAGHELAFVYAREGSFRLAAGEPAEGARAVGEGERAAAEGAGEPGERPRAVGEGGGEPVAEGAGAPVAAGAPHRLAAGDGGALIWEIRLARPGAPRVDGARRRVFASAPLEGIPAPAAVSFLAVTVSPRGGRTTVHTHPGPEFIYQLSGRIDYQNAIVGTKRLGPGGAEAIPPDTAVQKRNPYAEPGVFLSWFLVDPDRPFAPRTSFR